MRGGAFAFSSPSNESNCADSSLHASCTHDARVSMDEATAPEVELAS